MPTRYPLIIQRDQMIVGVFRVPGTSLRIALGLSFVIDLAWGIGLPTNESCRQDGNIYLTPSPYDCGVKGDKLGIGPGLGVGLELT